MKYWAMMLIALAWGNTSYAEPVNLNDPQVQQEALKKAQEMLNDPKTKMHIEKALQDPETQTRIQQVLQDPEIKKLLQQQRSVTAK